MAELPSHPNTGDDDRARAEPGLGARRPHWKTIAGITVVVVLLVLMVVGHLTGVLGPGEH